MSQIFVTGGSGFIGQVLVRRLVHEGHDVRVLVRSVESRQRVADLGATAVDGELTDATTYQDAVAGSEVFFHLAAETDITADRDRHERVTVGGTRAALQAAKSAGVRTFVHCGSEAALLAGDPLIEVDESAPLRPDSPAAYCAVKARSEQLVLDANQPAFETVSIRPRFVWGPDSMLTEGLVAAVRAHQFAWIEGSRQTTDITYVDNVVEGLVRGWTHGTGGEAYFVTDHHRLQLREFLDETFEIYGVGTDIQDLDLATAQLEIPIPALWFLGQTCTIRTEKAVRELGYAPVTSFDEGMAAVRARVVGASAS